MNEKEQLEFRDLNIWLKIGVGWGILQFLMFLLALISIFLTVTTGALA